MTAAAPALSVLVATSGRGRTVRRTLRHLRAQSIADRVEVILIGPEASSFDDLGASEAARPARHNANSAPVLARRHGKPTLLTMNSARRPQSAMARSGASAWPSADLSRIVRQAAARR